MATVIVNGVTYTDDDNSSTGMANGGHRLRFVPMLANAVIDLATKQAASAASQAAAAGSVAAAGISAATATTQANLAATQALSSSASASIATAAALSAASVLQQDLSAFTGALHRSPNAITAQFIYDTSKDSDGGAWIDRMQDKSWANEPLNGKWLGQQASEAACRAISGATTGDFFQSTLDGAFYKLNAGSGNTQVYRGNTAKFPRLSAIIAEASSVTIYDLTAPGRPMWMRFVLIGCSNGVATAGAIANAAGGNITSVAAINGSLLVATANDVSSISGLSDINFLRDSSRLYGYFGGFCGFQIFGTIAQRHIQTATARVNSFILANPNANSVAATILPDAPIDIATGLAVPTIAVATGIYPNPGGVSVIKHDGTVVNSSFAGAVQTVTINANFDLSYGGFPGVSYGWRVVALAGIQSGFSGDYFNAALTNNICYIGQSIAAFNVSNYSLFLTRMNRAATTKSISAQISNTFNTGHMVGDIRRCYLSSVTAETLSGAEKVTNGTFNTDTSGWNPSGNASIASVNQRLVVTKNSAGYATASQTIASVPGRTYQIKWDLIGGTTDIGAGFLGLPGVNFYATGVGTTTTSVFIATGTSFAISFINDQQNANGTTAIFDNISVKEADADRSYKAASATVYGTLTKTPVGNGSQLVAYSGFSPANYLQEPYSADLDFGTGDFSISAWVKYYGADNGVILERAAGVGSYVAFYTMPAGGLVFTIVDSSGANRAVSITTNYGLNTWIKVRANYSSGRLAILVNSVEVASVSGAPLLTTSNAAAVATIGLSRVFNSVFPGSIALLKVSGTVPTAEQALFAYTQEAAMFKDGAQVALPDAGAVQDLTYDDQQDKWVAVSTANESSFTGLVRTATAAASSGAFAKASARSGVKILSRYGFADITLPAYGLREELIRRAEAAAKQSKTLTVFDFDAIGAQTDFALPIGWRTTEVLSAGASKREGATKDWIRLYDGFRETIRFATAPGAAVWVQLTAKKE